MRFYPFVAHRKHHALAIEGRWLFIRLYPCWPFVSIIRRSYP